MIITTSANISDLAANLFAVWGESGDIIQPLVRHGVELADLVLVKPPMEAVDPAI